MADEHAISVTSRPAHNYGPGACERCWQNAFLAAHLNGGHQVDHYKRLLKEHDDERADTATALTWDDFPNTTGEL